jgi:HEPN superfamily AbiU2-like protein
MGEVIGGLSMPPKIAKWERWLEVIKQQLYSAMESQLVYTTTVEIVITNFTLPQRSAFYGRIQLWYAESIIMSVRRQAKVGQGISLAGLIRDIAKNPKEMTRKRWLSLWEGHVLEEGADAAFDALIGKGRHFIEGSRAEADLEELRTLAASCETWADKRIAHHDPGGEPKPPTFGELDVALDVLDRMLKKYYLYVTADGIASTVPVIQHDWIAVFEQPWLKPGARKALNL